MLIQLDVSLGNALCISIGNLWHHLSRLVHEVMLNEPLAHKLLGELSLWLTLGQFLLVAIGIEIPAGIRRVDLVDQIHLTVALAELIFGVNKD